MLVILKADCNKLIIALQGDYTAVIKETTAALKRNPKYVKALHRRSKAYKATGFLEESLEDITAVCILEVMEFTKPKLCSNDSK